MNQEWVFYLLLTILFWGVWMFLPKIVIRSIPIESAFVLEILGGVFFGLLMFGFVHLDFHVIGTFCALVAGFCSYLGAYCYFRMVKVKPVGLTASIASLYPVVTVALGFFILGERTSPKRIAGIALAMIAIYLMTLPKRDRYQPVRRADPGGGAPGESREKAGELPRQVFM